MGRILATLCVLAYICRAKGTTRRSTHDDLHTRIIRPHLIDQLAQRRDNHARRLSIPHVIRAEVHHDDIGVRRGEPCGEEVLVRDVGREVAPVAFVFAVVRDAAALSGESPDEVDVGVARCGQFLPEEGAPAAL